MMPRLAFVMCTGLLLAVATGGAIAACETKMTMLKESTAIYDVLDGDGKQIGTIERYSDNWGRRIVEIRNVTMTMMGMTMPDESHTVSDCGWIYAISKDGASATKTKNPMWDGMENAMREKGPQAAGREMMTATGFQATGEQCSRIGFKGAAFTNPSLPGDAKMCVDEKNGILLESYVNMGVAVNREVLVKFEKSAGPDAVYQLPAKITEGPDLSNLGLTGGLGNAQGASDNAGSGSQGQPQMPEGFDMKALQEQMEALQKQLGGQTQ